MNEAQSKKNLGDSPFIGRSILFMFGLLCSLSLHAQYAVHFVVQHPPSKTGVYLAGTFNGWNPGDSTFRISRESDVRGSFTTHLAAGEYRFKCTKGDWSKVESTALSADIDDDRRFKVSKDTTIFLKVEGWIDDFVDITRYPDSVAITICFIKSFNFRDRDLDSSYFYASKGYELAQKLQDDRSQVASLNLLGSVSQRQGNLGKALELYLRSLPLARKIKDPFNITNLNQDIGSVFFAEKDFEKAKAYFWENIHYGIDTGWAVIAKGESMLSLGRIYFQESRLDSSAYYAEKAGKYLQGFEVFILLGDIQKMTGYPDKALDYYRLAALSGESMNNGVGSTDAYLRISNALSGLGRSDSALYFARRAYAWANQVKNPSKIAEAGMVLSGLFEKAGFFDSAFLYQKWVTRVNDSLFNKEKERQIHNVIFNEQLRQQALASEQEKFKSRVWIFALAGGLLAMLLTAGLLIRNNRHRKEANRLLQGQKEKIENTLSELRATQSQLIQSEKMASLGELTAGIAHEIQNPLNFVNNFSGINTELLEDLQDAVRRDDRGEIKQLADQLKDNEDKIQAHGKRADGIVKSMLQHSRVSSAQKEITDINALADEYLRLSYHGLRAKDKSFNAALDMDFDPSVGGVNMVPQDIGRVLLNLYNNAFYAVMERKKSGEAGYEPIVRVETRAVGGQQSTLGNSESGIKNSKWVRIVVSDNGYGIPEAIRAKIFQPFFTTKPTGQGTGLGLSLSNDIVKAHGGTLQVEDAPGGGAVFVINLPVS